MAKGYFQQEGVDYGDKFSFVFKTFLVWVLFAYATHFNFDIHQMDVQASFLIDKSKEYVFMELTQ